MGVGLRHLQFATAAAQHGSLRRAAEALHIRQSTMSRAIRELEEHLGVALFVRSSSGARPTSTGTEFVKTARRLLADFDALVSRAEALRRGTAGRLTLGLPTSDTVARLRSVLLDYARECPDVDLRLAAQPKQVLLADLRTGVLDVAVSTGRTLEEGLESVALWSEQILLVVRETHPLAPRGYANWMDLGNETVLISRRGLGPELKEILTAKLAVVGKQARTEEHAIRPEALLSLVAANRGVSLQCESPIHDLPAGLVALEVHDGTGPTRLTYSACWTKQHTNPALACFLALLRAHRSVLSPGRVPDT
jgi:DNA-binding transcriptional LysR family regulator